MTDSRLLFFVDLLFKNKERKKGINYNNKYFFKESSKHDCVLSFCAFQSVAVTSLSRRASVVDGYDYYVISQLSSALIIIIIIMGNFSEIQSA